MTQNLSPLRHAMPSVFVLLRVVAGSLFEPQEQSNKRLGAPSGACDTKAIKQGGRSAHATRQKARWVDWGVLIAGALVHRPPRDRLAHTVGAGAKQPVKVAKVAQPIKS